MDVKQILGDAQTQYENEVSRIAEKVREELVIPFCDRQRLKFDAGMGCYSFENDKIIIYGKDNWEMRRDKSKDISDDVYDQMHEERRQIYQDTVELLSTLEMHDIQGCTLGSQMDPYDPALKPRED